MAEPLLSVCLITYNHAPYIRDAIDGVLKQKVDFPWELIIADDFSVDGTREIVTEYQRKHPDFIKLILQERNVGAARNWQALLDAPTSKYIAYFEGDDYWTDPEKLTKQVDFLETNPGYGLVFTDADHYLEDRKRMILAYDKTFRRHVPSGDVLPVFLRGINPYKSCTSCFRSRFVKEYKELPYRYDAVFGDKILWTLIAGKSNVGYIAESTAVYRVRALSASHPDSVEGIFKSIKSDYRTLLFFSSYFGRLLEKKKIKNKYQKRIMTFYANQKKYKQVFEYSRCYPLGIAIILKEFVRSLVVLPQRLKISRLLVAIYFFVLQWM